MATGINPETGNIEYKKTCVHCKKEFYSPSKGTRYCSQLCCDRHQKKVKHQREVYNRDKEYSRLVNKSYSLAREMAEKFLPKPDNWDNTWEVHHKDLNPLNNNLSNLVWLDHDSHEKVHSLLQRVNIVTVMKIWACKTELFESNTTEYLNSVLNNKEDTVSPEIKQLLSIYKIKEL